MADLHPIRRRFFRTVALLAVVICLALVVYMVLGHPGVKAPVAQ